MGACDDAGELRERAKAALRAVLEGRELTNPASRGGMRSISPNAILAFCVMGVLVAVALAGGADMTSDAEWRNRLGVALAFVTLSAAAIAGVLEEQRTALVQAAAADSLGRLADPLAAAGLVRALTNTNLSLANAAEAALPACLEAVREEHYDTQPPEATRTLCEELQYSSHGQALRILRALERAGDGSGLWPLRRLVEDPLTRTRWQALGRLQGSDGSVFAAASRVLDVLEKRREQEAAGAHLLRPATSPDRTGDQLVRPASSVSSVPEEQLLRPSAGDGGPGDG